MPDLNLIPYEDIYSEIKETLLLSRNQARRCSTISSFWWGGEAVMGMSTGICIC